MACLTKRLKNSTGSSFDLRGSTFDPSAYVDIDAHDDVDWRIDSDVIAKITSGDLVVNDGSGDLSIANGLLWFSYDPEEASTTRFQSDPERANDFVSKNVQDAVEEIKFSGHGLPWERVPVGVEWRIPINKQANLKEEIWIEGSVCVFGSLVIF